MADQWYYEKNRKLHGPISDARLRNMVSDGELDPGDLVWRDGMEDWQPLASLVDAGRRRPSPPPLPPPVAGDPLSPPRQRDLFTTKSEAARPRQERIVRASYHTSHSRIAWVCVVVLAIAVCVVWGMLIRHRGRSSPTIRASAVMTVTKSPTEKSSGSNRLRTGDESARIDVASNSADALDHESTEGPLSSDSTSSAHASNSQSSSDKHATGPGPNAASTLPADAVSRSTALPYASRQTQTPADSTDTATAAQGSEPVVLYQDVHIHRKPSFVVSGLPVSQEMKYRILSRLEVQPRTQDGTTKVVQFVENTWLFAADDLSRAAFQKSLEALQHQQFTYQLNAHHEVIEFTGHKKNTLPLPVKLPTMEGMLVTSVIDEDGWKELAQHSFLLPPPTLPPAGSWQRQMSHDWEPFGSWHGVTHFSARDVEEGMQRIDFRHAIEFRPPDSAGGASSLLPFRIAGAEFRAETATGTVLFDSQERRVDSVHEQFFVRGTVEANLLGQPVSIQVEEQQVLTIHLDDQKPQG